MITLNRRNSTAKEWIDQPIGDPLVLQQTFDQIKSINNWTLGYWPTMEGVKYFLKRYYKAGSPLSIIDIGCGDGETLKKISAYAKSRQISLKLTGIDLSREVIKMAGHKTKGIEFICADILDLDSRSYDLAISSLTMHHLSNEETVQIMEWMSRHVRLGWFISDLHRHAVAYYFIKYFSRLCRFNHMVCHDAPLSVSRGFLYEEWIDLINRAGLNLNHIKIKWYPNFRFSIRYEK